MKRRRMPYVSKIKRDDPFRSADRREIEAMVRRIAAAGETFSMAGWREEAGHRLFLLLDLGEERQVPVDKAVDELIARIKEVAG